MCSRLCQDPVGALHRTHSTLCLSDMPQRLQSYHTLRSLMSACGSLACAGEGNLFQSWVVLVLVLLHYTLLHYTLLTQGAFTGQRQLCG
jgi:hypothetical protein